MKKLRIKKRKNVAKIYLIKINKINIYIYYIFKN